MRKILSTTTEQNRSRVTPFHECRFFMKMFHDWIVTQINTPNGLLVRTMMSSSAREHGVDGQTGSLSPDKWGGSSQGRTSGIKTSARLNHLMILWRPLKKVTFGHLVIRCKMCYAHVNTQR